MSFLIVPLDEAPQFIKEEGSEISDIETNTDEAETQFSKNVVQK